MLSAKISMDDTYSNNSWAIVGSNYFGLKEINQMERELFAFLGWNVVTNKEELDDFIHSAEMSWAETQQARLLENSKRRTSAQQAAFDARHQQARSAARALLRPHTYREPSSSPSRSRHVTAQSFPASTAASPYDSQLSSPQHALGRMTMTGSSSSSSATSSTFPSAVHSPTSPASAPLSAGPQTPEVDHMDVLQPCIYQCHEESPDFPEAITYVSKNRKFKKISPSRERLLVSRA